MANEIIRPSALPAANQAYPDSAIVMDDGSGVKKATPQQIVDAGRPFASPEEAVAGSRNDVAMSPLLVRRALDARPIPAPAGFIYPENFGAVGDGVADDSNAVAAWAASGGALNGKRGSVYRLAKAVEIVFPLGSFVDLTGSKIVQDFDNQTNIGLGQIFGRVVGLDLEFTANNSSQRGFAMWEGSSIENFRFYSPTDFPANDDVRDGMLILRSPSIKVRNGSFAGVFCPINFYQEGDQSDALIQNIDMDRYAQAVFVRSSNGKRVVVKDIRYKAINANAATAPGHNALTGGVENMTVSGLRSVGGGSISGEHGFYLSALDGTLGVSVSDILSRGTGQCFMKFRGHDGLRLSDCHGEGTSLGNAQGTNEDGLRLENCRNVSVKNFSIRARDGAGPGGYDGIHLANTWNATFDGVQILRPNRSFIWACTATPPAGYSQSPNAAVENITINGITGRVQAAATPFLTLGDDDSSTTSTVKVGNITISGLDWDGDPANLVTVKAGVTRSAVANTAIRINGTIKGRPFSYVWAAASASGTLTWLAA